MSELAKRKVNKTIDAPASKSELHRALICAFLAKKPTIIKNFYLSNDIEATLNCISSLGGNYIINNSEITIFPSNKTITNPILSVFESGSTLRFFITVASTFSNPTFILNNTLINRPLSDFDSIFKLNNMDMIKENNQIKISGSIKPNTYIFNDLISSQTISSLLFILPILNGDSKIIINNKVPSKNYILMTIKVLKHFNINIKYNDDLTLIEIPGNQEYISKDYLVEGDYSQGSFFLSYALINDYPIRVNNLNKDSIQPDKNIISILTSLNGKLEIHDDYIISYPSKLIGGTIDLDDSPDLGPILMAISPFCQNEVIFKGITRLKYKESNRIDAMIYNLKLLGVKLDVINEDTLIIYHSKLIKPNIELNSFNDHRIFMSLYLITNNLDVKIIDNDSYKKSYPTFLENFK